MNLDFDTGSSDLWVFSSQLPAALQAGHSVYYPAKSNTSILLPGYTWAVTYGDSSGASGNVYSETVKVGATTVSSQAVEPASSVSAQFQQNIDNDGLLGLAFDSLNSVRPVRQKTFFSNAKTSLSRPLFTADLKRYRPGTYDFGFIDAAKYTGNITYINVDTAHGLWEFPTNGYRVGTGAFRSTSITAIADTGTSLLYLPYAVVSAYYAGVAGATYDSSQGGYTFPCAAILPSITLSIGSYRAVVPGSYMLYAPVSGSAGSGRTCFGGIQLNTGLPYGLSIYGDIFLKSQFVVFNGASTPQIGFARKAL